MPSTSVRLRHIEIFHAVLQAGTITGAAKLLSISQPAATKLLQQAERQIGFALFTRVRGRLHPTSEAALLRAKIEKISDEVNELKRLSANLKPMVQQVLRVVSTPTLANSLVSKVIIQVRKSFAESKIELYTQHSREMLNSILLRESDVGLTLQSIEHPGIRCETLCQGSVMVIAKKGYWSAEEVGRPVSIDRLAGSNVVGIATRDELGRKLYAHLESLSPPPLISIWVQTYQVARSLVAFEHGLALVDPFTAMGTGDDAIEMRPLEPRIGISLYAISRNDHEFSPLQKAFLCGVQQIAGRMLDDDGSDKGTPVASLPCRPSTMSAHS